MKITVRSIKRSGTAVALLAVAFGTGTLQANNALTATPSTINLACNTATTGPGSTTIVIKPATALTSSTIAVTFSAPGSGITVTAPGTTTLSSANQTAGLTYTVSLANGCVAASTGPVTFNFKAGGTIDVLITVNVTVTSTTTGLVSAPASVALTCVKTATPSYIPGPAQTVNVTSTATGGTPFTVDTVTNAPPAWATVNPTTGGTATATAVSFTVVAATGCGGFAVNTTNTGTIHLLNAPGPDKVISVSLQVLPPTVLIATPSPASLSYVKGSGSPGYVDVRITSATTPAPFFAVDTTSLPNWLNVDSFSGTVPKSLRFSSTSYADSLAPGNYNVNVRLNVSGYGAMSLPISLLVNNPSARLSVSEGVTRNLNWTLGQGLPTPFMTLVSSDAPIPYSIATGGTLAPVISASEQKGLAYNFGTAIPVTFNPLVFASAQPGNTLTGTVTITWGSQNATIVVTFNVTVQSPGATFTSLSPASLPSGGAAGTTYPMSIQGTGFVQSTDPTQKTIVGIVVNNAIVQDTNIAVNVVNQSNILLTITVPVGTDANLPFAAGGTVHLGLCNPSGTTCSVPTGQQPFSIGAGPIISAVTSASAFLQVTAPTLQTIAPYDILSIFGTNFCSSAGSGCSSTQVLSGAPDLVTRLYTTTLSPDAVSNTQRSLSVSFMTHATPDVLIANAPLLFASNNQINVVVPSGVAAQIGNTIDIVVNFGYASGATMKSSLPYGVTVQATNPGIFTVGSDGQGDGAILDQFWSTIGQSNPAGMRSTATDSDIVAIYMTGLGVPDSAADNSAVGTVGAAVWSTDCIGIASYQTSLNAATGAGLTGIDGAIIESALLNTHRMAPCLTSAGTDVPTVTVGGVSAPVQYAGWVADSVAGLYQVNIKLPGSGAGPFTSAANVSLAGITAPVQLPVVVTANSKASQGNVTVWVAPRLLVTGPSGAGLAGTVGVAWGSVTNSVTATEGTGSMQYIVTGGVLPAGLSLGATTGAITGTPAANTAGSSVITVTAIDSANVPVSGTVTFTLVVAGGLFLTGPTSTVTGAATTAIPTLATIGATGGTYPYTYAITSPSTIPAGMSIDANTGIISTTGTAGGTYNITVTATDTTTGTALTGTFSFTITLS
jgi:uncharacterized protein (TIGR03437 family)